MLFCSAINSPLHFLYDRSRCHQNEHLAPAALHFPDALVQNYILLDRLNCCCVLHCGNTFDNLDLPTRFISMEQDDSGRALYGLPEDRAEFCWGQSRPGCQLRVSADTADLAAEDAAKAHTPHSLGDMLGSFVRLAVSFASSPKRSPFSVKWNART